MAEVYECTKARSSLTSLQVLHNKDIAFATQLHGAKICSSEACSIKLNFANQYLNSSTTAICFSDDGAFLAFANDSLIYIVNLLTKEIVKTINTENEPVLLLSFDNTATHLIAGTRNGRVLHYKTEGLSLLCRLCSFPYKRDKSSIIRQNFVSAIVLRDSTLATSGYGGTIQVIDIYSRANTIVLDNGISRTNALCFLDDYTLMSGNVDGVLRLFDLKEKKLLHQLDTPLKKIRQIIILPNPHYVMICSQNTYISILDLRSFKIIHEKYIKFDDVITRIATLDEETLLVSLKNGHINKVVLPSQKQLSSLILHNSLEKAFLLTQNEPMLQDTEEYTKLTSRYANLYNEATQALINQNITLATQLLEPFVNLKSKKKEINLLFIAFKHYNRLKIFFVEKKHTLAYALCAKYPELENTPIYRKMEENFKDVFKNAQRQIILKKINNAKALLSPYITIPAKRNSIELLLKQNTEFLQFIIAVDKREYAKAYALAKKYKHLQNVPSYNILTNTLETYLDQIKESIQEGNTKKAFKTIELIQDIEHLNSQVSLFHSEIKHLKELQNHYENNDFKSCFNTLDTYPHLHNTQLGTLLNKHWHKLISSCEKDALKGDAKKIKDTLGELIFLDSRLEKIGDLFRVAYRVRIKAYISKKSYNSTEKTIYAYIDTFGIDSELHTLMQRFEKTTKKKLALTPTDSQRVARDNWTRSGLIVEDTNTKS